MEFEMQKKQNKKYLKELQKFFDLVDNIKDEKLKKKIIYQMIKCDDTLTELSKQALKKFETNK